MGKKTSFNKTQACLFIFYKLLVKREISKDYLNKILNIDSRTTLYNYLNEIINFTADFQLDLDHSMDIYYDSNIKKYVLKIRTKK